MEGSMFSAEKAAVVKEGMLKKRAIGKRSSTWPHLLMCSYNFERPGKF